ncbi:Crp/Fnr family transcriptional regulator [Roseomonas sp. KE2513]|uniref:Crp/Fnr family transcriptional regulator n=1 Tax=Roseomonas sp. KE2513 TaxID=2479202 RepID=UPI0018DF6B25|nr:Crp/Fnr family transcriptional regulator [Roseomonas sp. KE2513]
MPSQSPSHERHRLVRRLESTTLLDDTERQALMELPLILRDFAEGQDVVRGGDRPGHCCLVLTGFVCRYALLPDGRRQIMAFHPPGDIPDLQSLHLQIMDHSVGAIMPTSVAFIAHEHIHRALEQHPRLIHAFWRETLIDAAIFRAWMIGLGRRTAHERIAHLICEMLLRFEAVGLAEGGTFQMPVTQNDIADALGLSNVHVNRVLQDLRRDELISWQRPVISVLQREALQNLAMFDPAYLHMRRLPGGRGNGEER